jgi:glutamine synthetase
VRRGRANFEFRAADAAASPYLLLAALVHAGAQGIEERLPTPPASQEDLSALDETALSARGYVRLPQSLEAALERLTASPTVSGWFPERFLDVYVRYKQAEIAWLDGKTLPEVCAAYEAFTDRRSAPAFRTSRRRRSPRRAPCGSGRAGPAG